MTEVVRRGRVENGHNVVEHNGVLYLAGVAPLPGKTTAREQAHDVFAQIDRLLGQSRSSKEFILQARIYVTDFADKSVINEVWHQWLKGEELPARATIGVSDLGSGIHLEVVVVAAVPDRNPVL